MLERPILIRFISQLGVQWACTLIGCLGVVSPAMPPNSKALTDQLTCRLTQVLLPIPFVFYRYGAKIRERSRFAPCKVGIASLRDLHHAAELICATWAAGSRDQEGTRGGGAQREDWTASIGARRALVVYPGTFNPEHRAYCDCIDILDPNGYMMAMQAGGKDRKLQKL